MEFYIPETKFLKERVSFSRYGDNLFVQREMKLFTGI